MELAGEFLLVLVVTDAFGNSAESARHVLVDNAAPDITDLRREPPDLHEHHDGPFVLLADVEDVGAGGAPDAVAAQTWLDGDQPGAWTPMTHVGDGTWRHEVAGLDWDALGDHVLRLKGRAEDRAGNTTVTSPQEEPIDERNDRPVLRALPDVEVPENDRAERVLDLWDYASDEETATVDLEIRVEGVADPRVITTSMPTATSTSRRPGASPVRPRSRSWCRMAHSRCKVA